MDTSRWHEVNATIKIVETRNKFYSKFRHKITYDRIPFLNAIYGSKTFYDVECKLRLRREPTPKNIAELVDVYNVWSQRDSNMRIRIEGYRMSLFSNDEDLLYNIATEKLAQLKYKLILLSTVTNQQQSQALDTDCIILKNHINYTHKVLLKDGYYRDLQARHHLAQYLSNLGDEIKITKSFLYNLASNNKYLNSGYFYTNDINIVDMIRLIMPNVVRSIQKISFQ